MWNNHLTKDRRNLNIKTTTKFISTIIIGCKLQSNYTSMIMEQRSVCIQINDLNDHHEQAIAMHWTCKMNWCDV
jgi:hypothetical protein